MCFPFFVLCPPQPYLHGSRVWPSVNKLLSVVLMLARAQIEFLFELSLWVDVDMTVLGNVRKTRLVGYYISTHATTTQEHDTWWRMKANFLMKIFRFSIRFSAQGTQNTAHIYINLVHIQIIDLLQTFSFKSPSIY